MSRESVITRNIFVAGAMGMVGRALVSELESKKDTNILTPNRKELDLSSKLEVVDFFARYEISEVYLAAAKVGGIHANSVYPADFLCENLTIQTNVINSAYDSGVTKLLFLGSSCIYPKYAEQPISESSLLTGPLEQTNEAYAIAKIAGLKMCEFFSKQYGVDYRSVMPCNLYGAFDNFHEENSHVIPALIRRFHLAKTEGAKNVKVWGTGEALREFLYVDEMANACVYVMGLSKEEYQAATEEVSFLNVGVGKDITIKGLVSMIAEVVGYNGNIEYDHSKPDGTPRKILDVSRLSNLGWNSAVGLKDGLSITYDWYVKNILEVRV